MMRVFLCTMLSLLAVAPAVAQETGWDLFRKGEYGKAREALEKALSLHPLSVVLIDGVAWCDYYLGNYDEAEAGFRKALELNPEYEFSKQGLEAIDSVRRAPLEEAEALLAAGKYEEARAYFQRIAKGSTSTPENRLFEAIVGEGWCLYYLRDYAEAMIVFRRALKKKPGYAEVYRGIGYSQYMRGNYTDALVSLRLSFRQEPDDYLARLMAASCHFLNENYSKALEQYQTAASAIEGAWGAYAGEGWCHERLGDTSLALVAFQKAVDLSPYALDDEARHLAETRKQWWGLFARVGWSALRQHLYSWAQQEFETALLLDAEDLDARRGLAFVLFRLGDYPGALNAIDDVLENPERLAPVTFPVTLSTGEVVEVGSNLVALRGWTLLRLGRLQEALNTFRAVQSKHPRWVDAACGLGWTLYSQGNYPAAERAFADAENLVPGYPDAESGSAAVQAWRYADYNDAWTLIYKSRCDEAVQALKRILRATDRRFPPVRWDIVEASIGWAQYYMGNYAQAFDAFGRALELNPELGLAHKGKGFVLLAQGKTAEAVESLREALEDEAFEKDVETICNIAWAHRQLERPDQAEKVYQEALQLEPRSVAAMTGLAWAYLEQNRPLQALETFAGAVQLDPKTVDCEAFRNAIDRWSQLVELYATLGWAYYATGDYEQAERDFRTAREKDPTETEAQRGLGLALLGEGKRKEASRVLEEYFEQATRSENPWGVLSSTLSEWGWQLYFAKEYSQAVEVFERLAGLHARGKLKYADPHDGLGWCHLRLDQTDRARSEFLEAVRIEPRYESSLKGLEILKAMEQ